MVKVDIGYEDGRSKVVATKVRDVVRAIKPSLMRVFLSTARPVEFMPHGQKMWQWQSKRLIMFIMSFSAAMVIGC